MKCNQSFITVVVLSCYTGAEYHCLHLCHSVPLVALRRWMGVVCHHFHIHRRPCPLHLPLHAHHQQAPWPLDVDCKQITPLNSEIIRYFEIIVYYQFSFAEKKSDISFSVDIAFVNMAWYVTRRSLMLKRNISWCSCLGVSVMMSQ